MNKEWLNTEEAAEYIRHSASTLETWRHLGKGPKYSKPEGKVFYNRNDLDEWMKAIQ